ncbi:alpha-1,2-fucosyltransferase [Sphingobacterium siyangense]|uniref:alpha-1,2-fucosyltransferase n=1 Tax=Sphingobacterium siyangense TaxID=459529 RepID=UPI003DA1E0E0
MDVVIICNGLGNQMSQYAFFLEKKKIDHKTRFIFDKKSWKDHNGYELDSVFGIEYNESLKNQFLFFLFRVLGMKKYPLITRPIIGLLNILGISIVEEARNYDYDPKLLNSKRGIRFLYGGWHSEKYFHHSRTSILDKFKFQDEEDPIVRTYLEKIRQTNSVSVHIRRGDYLNSVNFKTFGSVCTKEYFLRAIDKIYELVPNPHFFVFSNDVEWVLSNFEMDNMTIVDCNKGTNSWKDIMLISECKHNINSNSSFSWWGAWLNKADNNVIVPKYFINQLETKDLYPDQWIRLTDY